MKAISPTPQVLEYLQNAKILRERSKELMRVQVNGTPPSPEAEFDSGEYLSIEIKTSEKRFSLKRFLSFWSK